MIVPLNDTPPDSCPHADRYGDRTRGRNGACLVCEEIRINIKTEQQRLNLRAMLHASTRDEKDAVSISVVGGLSDIGALVKSHWEKKRPLVTIETETLRILFDKNSKLGFTILGNFTDKHKI